ncbi:MAG: response regulator [Candidatus Hydrogenedentota bacterium]|nr:MAG: response regulator [Candidatus Hydrogenedentota bacterium]
MGKKRVLIADDDLDVLEVLKAILDHEGFHVRTARDGEQAFKLLRKQTFDAVILDVVMPKMTGVKLLQLMRRSSRLKGTPVMLVTGNLLETKRLEDNGSTKLANDFLSKPFNTRDLIKRVKALADSAPVKRQQPSPKSHPASNKKP